ncbi:tRNA pseudouridine(38-40) synthase TruA [Sphingorhabdus arenilitoris]|uniref:tRNA pseudouridine synthase A n=1 Tax=Sphingorhabdus arenilitoris TaxID=1490041 RepID=A0ABV8REA8_9SPHN
MPRFALTIEYDGGPYAGWQRQDNAPTVQGEIEKALRKTCGTDIPVYSAGRTDAGVHALAMRGHFDLDTHLTGFRLAGALNAHLRPAPIAIRACEIVDDEWHSRFSCTGRAYEYHIVNRRAPLALEKGKAWQIPFPLDSDAMHEAAQLLTGLHDFTTFRSTECQSDSPIKTLDRLDVRRDGERVIVEAAARSFLHHQVRSMVGCLALVGRGKWSAVDLQNALDAKDRARLGHNAPPDGLYFVDAVYPQG